MIDLLQRVERSKATEAARTPKIALNSQRSSFTNENEINNQHSNITNEKAALCNEIQRSDSTGLDICCSFIHCVFHCRFRLRFWFYTSYIVFCCHYEV